MSDSEFPEEMWEFIREWMRQEHRAGIAGGDVREMVLEYRAEARRRVAAHDAKKERHGRQ